MAWRRGVACGVGARRSPDGLTPAAPVPLRGIVDRTCARCQICSRSGQENGPVIEQENDRTVRPQNGPVNICVALTRVPWCRLTTVPILTSQRSPNRGKDPAQEGRQCGGQVLCTTERDCMRAVQACRRDP